MIISHKNKFIFIKTKKTAGTTIEVFLSPFCGPQDIITPVAGNFPGHTSQNYEQLGFYNHISANEVRQNF